MFLEPASNDTTTFFICMQIGNCVGAGNHRCFIFFLMSTVISTIYLSVMSAYAAICIWPSLRLKSPTLLTRLVNHESVFNTVKEIILAFLSSTVFLSARGLFLVYLSIASASVEIGLGVLLWQQLGYIYEGNTYLSHLSLQGSDGGGEGDCKNLIRFFGCPYFTSRYLPTFRNSKKSHKK
ncbi:unnamed protein product [Ilex paraguariensis]|uniref:S-acyltransferase n=1 Tax=Ilex paraguariensis TaxID=185542 RepID=A0ABC8R7N7_9AQUA